MSDEILKLMADSTKLKMKDDNINPINLNVKIRRKIRNAKGNHFSQNCVEIEEHYRKYVDYHSHKKIKGLARLKPARNDNSIKK